MSYRGMGQSGEVDTETLGWFHGSDVTGSDSPGYSTIIPFGEKAGAMMGGAPTAAQIAAGMPGGSGFDIAAWVKANSTTVYLAAGAFVLMSMFGRGRR